MPNRPILLGVVGRAHGVRGLVRVTSHTADPAALTAYGPLSDPSGRQFTLRWVGHGIAEISRIVDGKPVPVADRSAAEQLTNTQLFVERDRLPPPDDDEYYLTDLIGLRAVGPHGVPIGIVSAVHDYGAGASLEITRENAASLLVPFTAASVPEVDIAAGRLIIVPPDEVDVPETVDAGHAPAPERPDPAPTRPNPTLTRPDPAPIRPDPTLTRNDPKPTRHGPARPGHRQQQNRAAIDPPARPRADVYSPRNDGHAPGAADHTASDATDPRPTRAEAAA